MTEADLAPQQKVLWLKGLTALEVKNFDYVIALASELVKQVPSFLDGRRLLRRAESGKMPVRPGLFGRGLGLVGLKVSVGHGKKAPWDAIADLEEKVFKKDPYNIAANQELYDLAMLLKEPDLAAFALETIREGHPDNTRNMHALALHYMGHDLPEKAVATYQVIQKLDPSDVDAAHGERQAAAQASLKIVGQKRDEERTKAHEQDTKVVLLPEQQKALMARLLADHGNAPSDFALVKRIADLYCEMDLPEQAVPFYDKALQLNPGDVALAARAEEICNRVADRQMAAMEAAISADPTAPDAAEKRTRLLEIKQQRFETLLNQARAKVERNPTDKQYRFELAVVLYQCEQYRQAIPELQQARSNPHLRNKVLLTLGRCFMAMKMTDMAVTAFNEAVKEITSFTPEKKELLYELGLAYQKMGRQEDYLNCLKEIYHTDCGYRDVAERVESSYQ